MSLFSNKRLFLLNLMLNVLFLVGIPTTGFALGFVSKMANKSTSLDAENQKKLTKLMLQFKTAGYLPSNETFQSSVAKIMPGTDFDGQMVLLQIDALCKPSQNPDESLHHEVMLNNLYELYYQSFVDYLVSKEMPEKPRANLLHTLQAFYNFTPLRLPLIRLLINIFMLNKEQRDISIIEQAKTKRKKLFNILNDFEKTISSTLQEYATKHVAGAESLINKLGDFIPLMQQHALDIHIWRDWYKKGKYVAGAAAVALTAWSLYKHNEKPPFQKEREELSETLKSVKKSSEDVGALAKQVQEMAPTFEEAAGTVTAVGARFTQVGAGQGIAGKAVKAFLGKTPIPTATDIESIIQELNKAEYEQFKKENQPKIDELSSYLTLLKANTLSTQDEAKVNELYIALNRGAIECRLKKIESLSQDNKIRESIRNIKKVTSQLAPGRPVQQLLETARADLARLERIVGLKKFTTDINLNEIPPTEENVLTHLKSYCEEYLSEINKREYLIQILKDINCALYNKGGVLQFNGMLLGYIFTSKNAAVIEALYSLGERVYTIGLEILANKEPWNRLNQLEKWTLFNDNSNISYGICRFLQYCYERIGTHDPVKSSTLLKWYKDLFNKSRS